MGLSAPKPGDEGVSMGTSESRTSARPNGLLELPRGHSRVLLEIALEGTEEPVRARIRAGSLPAETGIVDVGIDEKAAMIFPA